MSRDISSSARKKRPPKQKLASSRTSRNTFVTKSGKTIKLNRSLGAKLKSAREGWLQHKAARLAGQPKTHLKRFVYRLRPKNLYHYWVSREGAIMVLKLFGIGVVVFFVAIVIAFAYLRKDLHSINNINGENLGGSISFYDRTGQTLLWQDYDTVKRTTIPYDQVSQDMKNATVAIEDKNFWHEGAFDLGAILRSAYHDVFSSGGTLYGGSTITEQLVKLNENWNGSRSILTKIKEIILATELDREYSKPAILGAYLNIAPYGGVDYGVQTAAQDYFGENASQLTLAQSAFLAAIPQSPSYYSPWSPDFSEPALVGREEYILGEMKKQGYINNAQEQVALNVNVVAEIIPQKGKYNNIIAPYFVLTALQQLENQFGTGAVEQGGYKVITTLNLSQQTEAQNLAAQNLPNVERFGGDEEAIVLENVPTAQVTALVGGVDFFHTGYGQINFATSLISPGSSFKLYDYTALINDNPNVGAGSVLFDTKSAIPGYAGTCPLEPLYVTQCPPGTQEYLYDYDFRFPGPETIRYAMAGSRNVPAVKAMLINGESRTISLAEQMGLTSGYNCYYDVDRTEPAPCYASAAIGDGAYLRLYQHVNGFATDARLGAYIPQTFILNVTDNAGKTIYQWEQPEPVQVVKPDAAYIIDNIISDPKASYLPGSCTATNCTAISGYSGYKFQRVDGWDVGVKTGTTNNDFDGLMMAITTQYAVGTWVGYHTDNQAMTPGQMEYMTEPLARGMITYVSQGVTPINWVAPAGIQTLAAYVQSAHVGLGSVEPGPSTDLFPSWYVPPKSSSSSSSYTVDVVSNDLATSCTPSLARKTISTGNNANIFSVDTFVNGGNATTSSGVGATGTYNTSTSDPIHLCGDAKPMISLQGPQSNSPPECSQGTCSFDALVTPGTHPLNSSTYPIQVNAMVDGSSISASCSFATDVAANPTSPASGTCTFPYSGSGQHHFQAQVVDSVLYDSESATVSMNLPVASTTVNNNSVTVNWTSPDSGSYSAKITNSLGNTGPNCNLSASDDSCTANGLAPGSYSVVVTDTVNGVGEDGPAQSFTVQ